MPIFWIMNLLPCFYVLTPHLFLQYRFPHDSCLTYHPGLRMNITGMKESETRVLGLVLER